MKKFIIILTSLFIATNFINANTAADSVLNAPAGQTAPSLYTGSISLNIPIYTINDPDFNLPISLVYNANAFMPSATDKPIAMNWTLNAGSKITRKLNSDDNNYDGRFYNSLSNYTTDIFYFNVNNCSGYFFITRDGEIKVVANEPFTIDISEGNAPSNALKLSVIKIVDKNGYTYFYGGDINALDQYAPAKPLYSDGIGNYTYDNVLQRINAWNLTKIVAPNGRQMTFSYLPQQIWGEAFEIFNNRCGNPFPSTKPTIYDENSIALYREYIDYDFRNGISIGTPCVQRMKTGYNGGYKEDDVDYVRPPGIPKVFEIDSWANKYAEFRRADNFISANFGDDLATFIYTKNSPNTTAVLSKIKISDIAFEMAFNYQIDSITHYYGENYKEVIIFLNTIKLKIDEEIRTCTLTRIEPSGYKNSPSSFRNKKLFLSKIKTFKGTEYNFNYNEEYDFNIVSSKPSVDDYGFSKINQAFGLIKSMTDELGAKTYFTFEKHNYERMKIYGFNANNQTDIILETNPKQNLYNNFRIQKIETKDENNNLVETKEYNYNIYDAPTTIMHAPSNPNVNTGTGTVTPNPNPAGDVSSGMLHCDFAFKYNNTIYGVFGRAILKSTEPYAVTYSKVTETVSFADKKYKNVYYFPTYEDLPDIFEENSVDLCDIVFFREKFWFYSCNSMSERRGLLKQKDEYEGPNTIKRSTLYEYQPLNIGGNNFIPFGYYGKNSYLKMYYAPTNTTKITTKEYFNGSELTTINEFEYDSKNRLSEHRTLDIDGKTYFTQYRYADDVLPDLNSSLSGFAGGFDKIQRQGWLGRAVEVLSGYKKGGTTYYTSGTISLFDKKVNPNQAQTPFTQQTEVQNYPPSYWLSNQSPYVPYHPAYVLVGQQLYVTLSREMSLVPENPLPSTNYTPLSVSQGGNVVFDETHYITTADYEYNNKLRLTKLIPYNAPFTTYIWDSKNLYPISETTNGFTTSFTYKLMIGLTSKTDPRGVTTYFNYDFLGRLIETSIDGNSGKEKLQNYQYHYKK